MSEKMWKLTAPVGNIASPAEAVNAADLRKYAMNITSDASWREKFEKDPIEEVIEWLERGGYVVDAI